MDTSVGNLIDFTRALQCQQSQMLYVVLLENVLPLSLGNCQEEEKGDQFIF